MEKNTIKIGLIGLGTVGSGVFKTLQSFKNVEITKIAVKNINKKRYRVWNYLKLDYIEL